MNTILFLMGIDFQGLLLILLVLTGLGLAIFFLSRFIFRKLLKRFSKKSIFFLSIFSVLILTPLMCVFLFWIVVLLTPKPNDLSSEENEEIYYESLDEDLLSSISKGMTKKEVVDLIGENDTTKNVMVYDLSLHDAKTKYILKLEFEKNKVINFEKKDKD